MQQWVVVARPRLAVPAEGGGVGGRTAGSGAAPGEGSSMPVLCDMCSKDGMGQIQLTDGNLADVWAVCAEHTQQTHAWQSLPST
jgi:hypothetical protein